jgi:hypothetical protein
MNVGLYTITKAFSEEEMWDWRREALVERAQYGTSHELCHHLPGVHGETAGIGLARNDAGLAADFMRSIFKDTSP